MGKGKNSSTKGSLETPTFEQFKEMAKQYHSGSKSMAEICDDLNISFKSEFYVWWCGFLSLGLKEDTYENHCQSFLNKYTKLGNYLSQN
jgi:hypothetical protein